MNQRMYYSREAEVAANRQRVTLALAMMIVGVGIGAVIATLFAPQSGAASREEIAESLEEAYKSTSALKKLRNEFDRFRGEVEERLTR